MANVLSSAHALFTSYLLTKAFSLITLGNMGTCGFPPHPHSLDHLLAFNTILFILFLVCFVH